MAEIDERVEFARGFLNSTVIFDDIGRQPPTEQYLQHVGTELQKAVDSLDTNDFDTLIILAAHYLRDNKRLPDWLATFAADVLVGTKKRPTKRGLDKYNNWERDYNLCRATEEVAKAYNVPYYHMNVESKKNKITDTAAGIVSQAAGCKTDVVINAYKKFSRPGG